MRLSMKSKILVHVLASKSGITEVDFHASPTASADAMKGKDAQPDAQAAKETSWADQPREREGLALYEPAPSLEG